MRMPLFVALTTSLVAASVSAEEPAPAPAAQEEAAQAAEDEGAEKAAFEAQLTYKDGDVVVGDNLATLHLGKAFRFLGPEDTEKVLVVGSPGTELEFAL